MSKILIVEDQPQMRKNIATILEMENFSVLTADNGPRGLELAKKELPDLILCDVMLPGLDGFGVLAALRADPATGNVPLIFLTARTDRLDLRRGMNLGAGDYLTKPVAREDLLAAIRVRLLRRQAQVMELQSARASGGFNPDFSSPAPLAALGLTARETEVLLWVAQGKSNADVAVLLGMAEKTVKKHLGNIFEKLGVESRNAASLRALEALHPTGGTPVPRP